MNNQNIRWHESLVSRAQRMQLNNHKSAILWFTGLSGSGKSTLAHAVEKKLHDRGGRTFVFDGDNVRHGSGAIALTAFISPYRTDRDRVRALVAPEDFI